METDGTSPAQPSKRPRPILLVLLGVVLVVFLATQFGGSPRPGGPSPSPRAGAGAQPAADGVLDPEALEVQLEALSAERPGPGDTERNPFRFQPKAPPPPPPGAGGGRRGAEPPPDVPTGPPPPPPPPPAPPITVKFIGTLDLADGSTVAIFTDCTVGRKSVPVREGQIILGQYRLVKMGLQSVVVEHVDGRGRTTLPKSGQDCVK